MSQEKTAWQRWYEKNRESYSALRRKRYKTDKTYREKAKANAKRYRRENPVKAEPSWPPEYQFTMVDAAYSANLSVDTLRDWMKKGYYPRPKLFGMVFRFTESQVGWVLRIAEFFEEHGSRQGAQMEEFEDLKDLIRANW
jgi:hypothetical protein